MHIFSSHVKQGEHIAVLNDNPASMGFMEEEEAEGRWCLWREIAAAPSVVYSIHLPIEATIMEQLQTLKSLQQ